MSRQKNIKPTWFGRQGGTTPGMAPQVPGTTITQQFRYQAPYPPAAEMERLARIDPALPGRVMLMAETQAGHRQKQEGRLVTFTFIMSLLGLGGGLLAVYWIVQAIFAAIDKGLENAASVLGGVTVVALAAVFVTGRRRRKNDEGTT